MGQYDSCGKCGHVRSHHKTSCHAGDCTCGSFEEFNPIEEELQTCPRRVGELGPWEYKDNLDRWKRSKWHSYYKSNRWPDDFEKPRTCSFCGSVHPDDLVDLLKKGWRVGNTDKSYKKYIEAPIGYKSPIPPLKLYVMHCSQEQINKLNKAVNYAK